MIAIQNIPNPDVLALTISHRIRTGNLNDLNHTVKWHESEYDDPHLFIEMEEFRGWEDSNAFWEDLKLVAEYIGEFSRGRRFTDKLTSNESRHYFPEDRQEAWQWIRNKH